MSVNFDYTRLLVVDLEATCWQDITREEQSKINEIIQIGIVEVDLINRCLLREACYFVKPTVNTILTPYCTELTGITQQDVDSAQLLMKVSKTIRTKFNPNRVVWGAWGDDNILMQKESKLKNAVMPFSSNYYDLQELFALKKGASKRTKVSTAMAEYGLEFEGNAHNALVDARNTARLLLKLL